MMGNESSHGDKLYQMVEDQLDGTEKQFAGNITGMLLELETIKIEELLTTPQLLCSAIHKALAACRDAKQEVLGKEVTIVKDNKISTDRDTLGDRLFDEVVKINTDEAPKLTGMLLELDTAQIEQLISSPEQLQAVVQRALLACSYASSRTESRKMENGCWEGRCSQICGVSVDRDRLGDLLYERVEKICPDDAPKVTGMLLERDMADLHRLLADDRVLHRCIQKAKEALHECR